jgi:hypothetical protein
MFIALVEIFDQRRSESGIQLDLQLASTFPLLRTPWERFCSSSYKHATPKRGKTHNVFFPNFGSGWVSLAPTHATD